MHKNYFDKENERPWTNYIHFESNLNKNIKLFLLRRFNIDNLKENMIQKTF